MSSGSKDNTDRYDDMGGWKQVDRNIWLDKGPFQWVKDLNDYELPELREQLDRAQGVAVYLCWEVMNSVTLHAVAGSESIALVYSKLLRNRYEREQLPCKIKIERTVVNHFFATTMVDYAVHDPTYVHLRDEFSKMRDMEEKDKIDSFRAKKIIEWAKEHGYATEESN